MNRRAFVSRVVGGVVAAAVAPFVPLPKQGTGFTVHGFDVFPPMAAQQFKTGDLITFAGGAAYRITDHVDSGNTRHFTVRRERHAR